LLWCWWWCYGGSHFILGLIWNKNMVVCHMVILKQTYVLWM
jgi:hypothetical protein